MRLTLALTAVLLTLFVAAATGAGWKWDHNNRPIAGWTWDDAYQMYVETPDPVDPSEQPA